MKIEKIKPIPKYILRLIQKKDKETHPKQDGHIRYYAYLAKNEGELCKVFVAVKCHKGKWYCKQCIVHGIHSDYCLIKDMKFTYGMDGYTTGFYDLGLYKVPQWFESGEWEEHGFMFNPWAPIVNKEYLSKFPEYRYSAYELYRGSDIFSYIQQYEEYPQLEFFVKRGLSDYCYSVQMLKKFGKDKGFRKWLYRNCAELKKDRFTIPAVMRAYKNNISLNKAQRYVNLRKDGELKAILDLFGDDLEQYLDYAEKKDIGNRVYLDYLKACNYLGLDMTEDKNRLPHDFERWHDIRIDEADSKRQKEDRKKRRELYKKFSSVADKYAPMQKCENCSFFMFIAKSPAELQKEGRKLNHCVGSMGYDQKFAREESLIFFLRKPEEKDKPYVTVEYSLKQKKVLQCYAAHNSSPSEDVKEYVDAVWLPYANKALKKIMKERKAV